MNRKKESEEIFEKKADLNVKVREKWYDLGGEKKKKERSVENVTVVRILRLQGFFWSTREE